MTTAKDALKRLLWPLSARPHASESAALIQAGAGQSEDRIVTNADLEHLIDQFVARFKSAGVGKGSRVTMTSPNCPELGAAILAAWRLNATAVPVDFRVTAAEFVNISKRVEATMALKSSRFAPDFEQELAPLSEAGIKILDLSFEPASNGQGSDAKLPDELDIDLEAPAIMILTSGTTGVPKGAVHDLGTLVLNMVELGDMAEINDQTNGLLPLPLSHIFGLEVFCIVVSYGGTLIFSDLSPQGFLTSLNKYDPEILVGVPTIYGAMMALPKEHVKMNRARIILSGGAPLPLSLAEEFKSKFGKRINNGYGSTESKIFALNLDGPFESVGKIVPSTRVEILNDNREPLPEGETGEIVVSGPILMKGYLGQPDLTAKVLSGGKYFTGDMGRLENGYLFVSGRSKEMIIVAGHKVFPTEVEDCIRQHPEVKEVAVVGPPHKQLGQIVKAIIVVNEGELSDKLAGSPEQIKEARQSLIADLKEHCKANLKRELRPMDWDFLPSSTPLPKTASGKVDKKQLVEAK